MHSLKGKHFLLYASFHTEPPYIYQLPNYILSCFCIIVSAQSGIIYWSTEVTDNSKHCQKKAEKYVQFNLTAFVHHFSSW